MAKKGGFLLRIRESTAKSYPTAHDRSVYQPSKSYVLQWATWTDCSLACPCFSRLLLQTPFGHYPPSTSHMPSWLSKYPLCLLIFVHTIYYNPKRNTLSHTKYIRHTPGRYSIQLISSIAYAKFWYSSIVFDTSLQILGQTPMTFAHWSSNISKSWSACPHLSEYSPSCQLPPRVFVFDHLQPLLSPGHVCSTKPLPLHS
jgi:hypothetical protein